MKDKKLKPGKLPHRQLERILAPLSKIAQQDETVIVGPSAGVDAAIVKLKSGMIAITSDPITLTGQLAPYYCINVNANDLAVMGAKPEYMTISAMFPPCSEKDITNTAKLLAKYAKKFNITIIGGHTEITTAVNSPLLVATMLGRVISKRIISSSTVNPGDVIIMTKSAGIEATAIISREKEKELKKAGWSAKKIEQAKRLLFNPSISIVPEATIASTLKCSAMHDVTEGGVITALWELSHASNLKIDVYTENIPILPITQEICDMWNIDPLKVISSGSLLIAISRKRADKLLDKLKENKIQANIIASASDKGSGAWDVKKRKKLLPCQDELVKIYL